MRRQSWLIFGLFLLWSLVLTYPLVKHFETHIPRGTEPVGTVPLFNLWTLQWNIDQLMAGYSRYWNTPIFAPAQGTFAFSEAQFLTGVLAAPIWLNFGPGAGYNIIILLFLTLNGWFAYHLLRLWQVKHGAALVSGLLCQGMPFIAQEMGVLQLTAIFSLLWNLLFLSRILRWSAVPDQPLNLWSTYISLGLGLPVTFLTCSYYGLFSLILMPLAFLCLASRNLLRIQTWLGLTLSMMIAFGLTYPFISTQQAILTDYGFTRSEKSVRATSAKETHYHQFLNHNVFYTHLLGWEAKGGLRLFPGLGVLTLACIGLMTWGRRRIRLYLLLILLLAYYLSLGFNWQIGDQFPYQLLRDYLLGFTHGNAVSALRSPFRFALLVQLHLILLAGLGLDYLLSSITSCALRLAPSLTLILLISFTLLESLHVPLPLQSIPPIQPLAAWQTWLKEQHDNPRLVFLPFAPTGKTVDFEQTVHWMIISHPLKAEMINGYSGFFPPWHQRLRQSMLAFPELSSVVFLRTETWFPHFEVDYVIVDHDLPQAPTIPKDHPWLRIVYEDKIEKVTILRVKK